jgi:acetyl-CoA synthetase
MNTDLDRFLHARDFLLRAGSYDEARAGFAWPDLTHFNWALDYFDAMARGNAQTALLWVDERGAEVRRSFDELARRSNQVANFFKDLGFEKSDTVLLMLSNTPELYDTLLAALKTSVVVIPASTLLTPADIEDRLRRGKVRHIIAEEGLIDRIEETGEILKSVRTRVVVGRARHGWVPFAQSADYPDAFKSPFPTYATDPCLLYFTSGTTALPKMVLHTHTSYPVGHLVTMYWIGLRPGDVHYNISAPGWGKHAWSSLFAPWNAGATVLAFHYERFDAGRALHVIQDYRVNTLCAPPTVWRRFAIEDLARYRFALREIVSAGEPLNPEITARVRRATGLSIREGYGQTETVLQIGTFPGMAVKDGAMGRAAPGFRAQAVGPTLMPLPPDEEGQVALRVAPERPLGLMKGYRCDRDKDDDVFIGGWYLTGDVARVDADGYFWFVGRNDDVFKSSDYRISPFEVESELLAHPAVAEAAVVGSVDEERGVVPKAFVALKPGCVPSPEMAVDIFRFCRHTMAPYKRPRRLEFMEDLLKTISGKIKRAELRKYDDDLRRKGAKGRLEFMESDFAAELGRRAAPH